MHERFAIILILSIGLALVLTSRIIISTLSGEESFHNWWGKETKLLLRVVDDDGQPVEGAKVTMHFRFIDWGKINTVVKQTDADGRVEVRGRCVDGFDYTIEKEGWYNSRSGVNYMTRDDGGVPYKDGKWLPYGEEETVRFKKIRKPIPMAVFTLFDFKVPKADQEYGFDMEYGRLVEPYGPGKVADFHVKYSFPEEEGVFWKTMTITFPNCLDGAYLIDLDEKSKLASPYHADAGEDYAKTFTWKYALSFEWQEDKCSGKMYRVATEPTPHCDERLAYNQGLVLRTRTKVDADGNLVSAHYGKIYGEINLGLDMYGTNARSGAILFFNPTENDTNLEFDNKEHLLDKNLRKPNGRPLAGGHLFYF